MHRFKVLQIIDSAVIEIAAFSEKKFVIKFIYGCWIEMIFHNAVYLSERKIDLVVEDCEDPTGEMLTAHDFYKKGQL